MPDPLLVAMLAGARLLPLIALVAWTHGASGPLLAGLAALGWALTAGRSMRARSVGDGVRKRAASDAAAAIARRAPQSLRGAAHDAVLVRIWRGFIARSQLATDVEPTIVAMLVALPAGFVLTAWATGWRLPAVAVAAGALSLSIRVPLARRHRVLLEPVDAAVNRLARDLGTGMRALDDLHAHGLERAFAERIAVDADALHRAEGAATLASALATWTPVLVASLALLAWLSPELATQSSALLFRGAILLALAPIGFALMRALVARSTHRRDARSLDDLVAMAPDLAPPGGSESPARLAPFVLEKVSFRPTSIGSAKADVFDRVTVRWNGERPLALVGPNGSGKTSIIALLLRLADPDEGSVTIAGVALASLAPASFRARIAYVPQRPLVLEGMNVREAMALIAPAATDDVLLAALAEVDLAARLRARGDPLDVPCASLSAGEAQRVAVARALARDAELLVLDEPEAGLDADARARLRRALERRIARGTLVVIAAQVRDVVPEGATILELPLAAESSFAAA